MTKPPRTAEEEAAYDAMYKTWFLPWGWKPKTMKGLMRRRRMYDKFHVLGRRRSAIYFTISDELQRQGVGADEALVSSGLHSDTLKEAVDARLAAWADARDSIDPPVPRTPLEDLLDEHCRLQQQEYDMLDDIEKREGAVSPLYDSRPYSVMKPCPYPLPELVSDPKQQGTCE